MKVSFPLMANYKIPSLYLIKYVLNCEVVIPPKTTKKTVELGEKYSPDFVCTPFKYTLGNFIESLDMGADTLIQLGGGCRYGYYFELQELILKDLGYDFKLYNLVSKGRTDLKKIYKIFKEINPKFNIKNIYHILVGIQMIKDMDYLENYVRLNSARTNKNLRAIYSRYLYELKGIHGIIDLKKLFIKYKRKLKIKNKKKVLKIGIIGELYTVMDSFANYDIEDYLINRGISVNRYMNATYLLLRKRKKTKKYLKKLKNVKYRMGADAMDNIYYTKYFIDNNYDGVIHIKSSFCTPEIASMSVINKICKENNFPCLFMSMDLNSSKVGIETRLEAFIDMIEMRNENE